MPRDRGQPAARAQEHGRRRLRRRSSSGRAAQATGPLLRPQGRFAFPAEMACGHPRPRRPRRPLGQEERAGAGPAPARRAARRAGGRLRVPRRQGTSELAFDNQKRGGKITQMQARAQGPVASSQQSHLAKLRHTEPGVHETRDAPSLQRMVASRCGDFGGSWRLMAAPAPAHSLVSCEIVVSAGK